MDPARSREEVASLYRRHVAMVYQICLGAVKKRARRGGRNPRMSFAR